MGAHTKVIKPRLCDYCNEIIETNAAGLKRHSVLTHGIGKKKRPMGKPAARRLIAMYRGKGGMANASGPSPTAAEGGNEVSGTLTPGPMPKPGGVAAAVCGCTFTVKSATIAEPKTFCDLHAGRRREANDK